MVGFRKWFSRNKLLGYLLFALSLSLLSLSILQFPLLNSLNNLVGDLLQGSVRAREEVVVVAIDDASLQEIGAWPWSRDIFATGLNTILEGDPAVVGLDVLFLEARENDELLKTVIEQNSSPVVFGSKIVEDEVFKSFFAESAMNSGFVNFYPDVDGKIRQTVLTQKLENECQLSFSLAVYANYLKISPATLVECQQNDILRLRGESYDVEESLSFKYATETFSRVSFIDVISGKVDSNSFKDKIVLVGSTALDLRNNLNDNFTSIFGQSIPGVELHANIINSFLEEGFFVIPNTWFVVATVLLLTLLASYGYYITKQDIGDIILLILVLGSVFAASLLAYAVGIKWPVFTTLLVLAINYIYAASYRFTTKSNENRYVKQVFAKYLSGKLLSKLLQDPSKLRLGGETRVMTVLFSDIRSFTTISESMQPEELLSMLNEYLTYMTSIVLKHDGTIDKYIGDAIMALWNAPLDDENHVEHALETAMEMTDSLVEFNHNFPEYPDLAVGIGVNTGKMTVGNIGGFDRFDYTVLGDNVNLGARLEGLTKKYGVPVICTEYTVAGYEGDKLVFRLLDEVRVKGKSNSVKIYQPLYSSEDSSLLVEGYESAFKIYQEGDFLAAVKLLKRLSYDPASHKLIKRCEQLLKDAPEKWDGIWNWDEK